MDFLTDNILLIFCFVGSAVLLLLPYISKSKFSSLNPAELVIKVNKDNAMLIDVRDKNVYETGSLGGAVNIPACDLAAQLNSLPKDRPLVFICQDGRQASQAARQVRTQGYKDTHILNGGLNSWTSAQLPLVVPDSVSKKPVRKKSLAGRKASQEQKQHAQQHPQQQHPQQHNQQHHS